MFFWIHRHVLLKNDRQSILQEKEVSTRYKCQCLKPCRQIGCHKVIVDNSIVVKRYRLLILQSQRCCCCLIHLTHTVEIVPSWRCFPLFPSPECIVIDSSSLRGLLQGPVSFHTRCNKCCTLCAHPSLLRDVYPFQVLKQSIVYFSVGCRICRKNVEKQRRRRRRRES